MYGDIQMLKQPKHIKQFKLFKQTKESKRFKQSKPLSKLSKVSKVRIMYTVQYMSPYVTYLPGKPWTSLTTQYSRLCWGKSAVSRRYK